jgi:O-antigen/teichoic acid export membrane protein
MSLRKQAVSLGIMHAAEVIQPLLVLPYAGRILGTHHFGQYIYAISLGQFATTIVEYGFHWTAQRAAAAERDSPPALAALLAEVTAVKVALCVLVTFAGLVIAEGVLAIGRPLFLCAMLAALGGILFPAWLLIGLERASQAAIAVVATRVMALVGFFLLVTSPEDVEMAVGIQSGIPLLAGVIALPFVARLGFGGFRCLTIGRVIGQLRAGWRGFVFSFVERASITLPIPFVAHFGGYAAAGVYSVADRFVAATRPFFRVMIETFLPRVAYHASHDRQAGIQLIQRSLATLVVGVGLSLGLFFVAPYVILLLFGEAFSGAIPIVRVLAILPILLNVNFCTSSLYMFNFGHERAWLYLTLCGLLVFLAAAAILPITVLGAPTGVAIAVITKELVVLVVSAGFFLTFGLKEAPSRQQGGKAGTRISMGALIPSAARAGFSRSLPPPADR